MKGPVRSKPAAPKASLFAAAALPALLVIAGCHVQWISPYSADLQKKASDMLSEVVAWEGHMRSVAGTAAADPRNPEVQAKLQSWRGEIEAMAQIELGIDPGAAACDKFLDSISGGVSGTLKTMLPTGLAAASSATKPVAHCETLPNIFTKMHQQVTGDTPQSHGMPFILDQTCRLPWLPDGYFAALNEAKATTGAPSPARPVQAAAKARAPTPAEQAAVSASCRSLFEPPDEAAHGNLLTPLIIDLDSIIYREGRQAPTTNK